MTLPPLTEAAIRHHANANSFSRGEQYYRQGAVTDIVRRGNALQAWVEGSEATPYRVQIQGDTAGITAAHCTCPYDYDGWCKHIVAAALTWVHDPDAVESRFTLPQLLDRLDHVQTQRLVQTLVEQHPELIDEVDDQVMALSRPAPPTAPRRRPTLDVAPARRQIKQILREGLRSLEEGYEDDPFSDELLPFVERARALAAEGDGLNAIALLETITSTYADEWDELLEYGGDSFSIADELDTAWAEAILCADLPAPERVDLEVQLQDWQEVLEADFSACLTALAEGWDDPGLQQRLQGQNTDVLDQNLAPADRKLATIRLHILDQQGRQQDYLNLALAEGLMEPYLTRLVQVGEVDLALETARSRMTTSVEAFALAQVLRQQERLTDALAIAQTGLTLPGGNQYDLASWLVDLAEGLGRTEVALEASVQAFKLQPSLGLYQRVQHLAQPQWDTLKPDLLKALRRADRWSAQQAKVDIFLHEGLMDDAIRAVQSDSYYRSELLMRVVQAATSQRPDWVIETARNLAEPTMDQGKASRYQDAVQWLKQVKAAYVQSDRRSEWDAYFHRLQVAHGRKRKLMDLFSQLR